MRDARIDEYARLLVDRSVGVQPGWQVLLRATPLARPLVEAVQEQIARRGAYPLLQLAWDTVGGPFAREAPLELLATPAPLLLRASGRSATRSSRSRRPRTSATAPTSRTSAGRLLQQRMEPLRRRQMAMEVPWVICEYPTNAAAQEAGMTLSEYEEFVFGAVLLDWDAEARRMQRDRRRRFDAASEVRIVGERTDLTLSLAGRSGAVDDGHINMPGGEVFYSPVEDSAEGEVTFCEFPALYFGHEVSGARLVFERGRIVEASAAYGRGVPARARSTPTRARGGSASSGSAATRGSAASRRTSASTRRSTARSTSPSGTRTRRPAART